MVQKVNISPSDIGEILGVMFGCDKIAFISEAKMREPEETV